MTAYTARVDIGFSTDKLSPSAKDRAGAALQKRLVLRLNKEIEEIVTNTILEEIGAGVVEIHGLTARVV